MYPCGIIIPRPCAHLISCLSRTQAEGFSRVLIHNQKPVLRSAGTLQLQTLGTVCRPARFRRLYQRYCNNGGASGRRAERRRSDYPVGCSREHLRIIHTHKFLSPHSSSFPCETPNVSPVFSHSLSSGVLSRPKQALR
jgi:hypothetical protein